MDDLIDRQAAIDAVRDNPDDLIFQLMAIEDLPSLPQKRIVYANMSDEEFERWLHEHGICNPDIHERIPCVCVPLLIDYAISELPSSQPELQWTLVSDGLPEEKENPNTRDFEYVLCSTIFGDVRAYKFGTTHGSTEPHFWQYGLFPMDDYVVAWMYLPKPWKGEDNERV